MKIPAVFATLFTALLALAPVGQTQAQGGPAGASFDLFYNTLADDGDWYNTPEYGYVWQPNIAQNNPTWRPYSDGYWAQTDDGWTWVSYESFGWAAYHYGRWTNLSDLGWAWVPGYDWGPGWVSWRTSNDYVGWAPLPPQQQSVSYQASAGGPDGVVTIDYNQVEDVSNGYTPAVDANFDIGPQNYCFVACVNFGAPVLAQVLLPPQQNFLIVQNTVNVTNIYYNQQGGQTVVYNRGGPDYAFISTRVSQPIQRLQLQPNTDPGYLRGNHPAGFNPTQVHNGVLLVAAPAIARGPVNFQQVKPPRVKAALPKAQVEHGWTGVNADPKAVQAEREKITQRAQTVPKRQPNGNIAMPPAPISKAPVAEAREKAGPPPIPAAPQPKAPAPAAKAPAPAPVAKIPAPAPPAKAPVAREPQHTPEPKAAAPEAPAARPPQPEPKAAIPPARAPVAREPQHAPEPKAAAPEPQAPVTREPQHAPEAKAAAPEPRAPVAREPQHAPEPKAAAPEPKAPMAREPQHAPEAKAAAPEPRAPVTREPQHAPEPKAAASEPKAPVTREPQRAPEPKPTAAREPERSKPDAVTAKQREDDKKKEQPPQ